MFIDAIFWEEKATHASPESGGLFLPDPCGSIRVKLEDKGSRLKVGSWRIKLLLCGIR
jgi:hypothetical protein